MLLGRQGTEIRLPGEGGGGVKTFDIFYCDVDSVFFLFLPFPEYFVTHLPKKTREISCFVDRCDS